MSRLDEFLSHHVENYLFYDIGFMERDDEMGGGVGYPMLMTCCAGIEFLGALRSRSRFQARGLGYQYFREYWGACLYPNPPFNAFDVQVYQLIRHGIAHSFVTKGHIGVVRKQPHLHFKQGANNLLLVDAVQLGRDLKASYLAAIKPILTDPARSAEKVEMEKRLTEMEADYATQAATHGLGFSGSVPTGVTGAVGSVTQSTTVFPGVTGPTGPLLP